MASATLCLPIPRVQGFGGKLTVDEIQIITGESAGHTGLLRLTSAAQQRRRPQATPASLLHLSTAVVQVPWT